jgi:Leucine-rich repeat (LRR) protein
MKKYYFLLLAFFLFTISNAQIIIFPDAKFKAKLLEANSRNKIARDLMNNYFKIDANGDGEIQESEALQVSYLDLKNSMISSIIGIKSFGNIKMISCSNNQLSSLNLNSLVNITHLDCSYNQLTLLDVSGLTNLQDLNFGNNQITSFDASTLTNVISFACNFNQLTALNIINSPNLLFLSCTDNQLTNLNLINLSNLKSIYCSNNLLASINVNTFSKLEVLSCSYNILSSLDLNGLTNLQNLYCFNNLLTGLDTTGLNSLKEIICYHNQMTSIKVVGLSNLNRLECYNNLLTSLDLTGSINNLGILAFTNNAINIDVSRMTNLNYLDCGNTTVADLDVTKLIKLKYLMCRGNQLTSLNLTGLTKIEFLECSDNNLTNIDLSSLKDLRILRCDGNKINSLNLTGLTNLEGIDCNDNNFSSLDASDLKKLTALNCNNNTLMASIYLKNGSNETSLYLSNTPNLKYICVDENQIAQVQNLIFQNGYMNCVVNSYCSFIPGGTFYTIQGNNRLDSDKNGCNVLDIPASNIKFTITNGTTTGNLISDGTGNYSIKVQEGTYTITPVVENPSYITISPASLTVTFPTQTSPFIQNFCVTPNGSHQDLEVTILPTVPARPGFDATYKIIYKNKGNITQSGAVILSFNDSVLDYVSAVPVVNNQFTDKLTWDYINLQPFETREITVTLNVNSPMETPAVNIGDRLSFNALINPQTDDEKPVDNSSALRQSVVGSFDPNDKTCLEGDVITPSLIGEYVNYLIRFENTGTYPAQNIVVKDLIDLSKFDISTLTPTKASHSYITKISEGNKVEFIFENINLPFDNATNDGYIAFKIKTLPTLVVGDSFANEANIYFDYNFPILTNKTTSTFKILGTQDFEFSDYFSVYPNPVNDIVNIGTKNTIEVQSMAVYDILGQIVISVPNTQTVSKIDVSKLTTGNYFLKVNTNKGTSSMKLLKN